MGAISKALAYTLIIWRNKTTTYIRVYAQAYIYTFVDVCVLISRPTFPLGQFFKVRQAGRFPYDIIARRNKKRAHFEFVDFFENF